MNRWIIVAAINWLSYKSSSAQHLMGINSDIYPPIGTTRYEFGIKIKPKEVAKPSKFNFAVGDETNYHHHREPIKSESVNVGVLYPPKKLKKKGPIIKKIPVPYKVIVPQPYPVEKLVPYPVPVPDPYPVIKTVNADAWFDKPFPTKVKKEIRFPFFGHLFPPPPKPLYRNLKVTVENKKKKPYTFNIPINVNKSPPFHKHQHYYV